MHIAVLPPWALRIVHQAVEAIPRYFEDMLLFAIRSDIDGRMAAHSRPLQSP